MYSIYNYDRVMYYSVTFVTYIVQIWMTMVNHLKKLENLPELTEEMINIITMRNLPNPISLNKSQIILGSWWIDDLKRALYNDLEKLGFHLKSCKPKFQNSNAPKMCLRENYLPIWYNVTIFWSHRINV